MLALELARDSAGVYVISQALPAMSFKTRQQLMEQHPFVEKRKPTFAGDPASSKGINSALRSMGVPIPFINWDQDDIDGYNGRVRKYLDDYALYEGHLKSHKLDEMRTLSLRFAIVNSGSAPATNVDVKVYFPPQITIFDSADDIEEPKAPKPPEKAPLGRAAALFTAGPPGLNLKSFNKTYTVDAEQGLFSFHADNVKHHHHFNSPVVKVRPQTVDDIADFEVQYVVTSNELVDRVEGKLVVRIVRDDAAA